jgi:glycosyltransferase involved in cell wall biosynthesis
MSNPPLVTAFVFVSKELSLESEQCKKMEDRMKAKEITICFKNSDDRLEYEDSKSPRVYFTVGPRWEEFQALASSPLYERKRWLHFEGFEAIQPFNVFNGWLSATDPLPENKTIPPNKFSSEIPLVSVFTPTYRSGERIKRPYRSLLAQTYQNWEWVILDDSGDDDKTYNECILPLKDHRIKKFRQEQRNGYIGTVKRAAAGLCTGEILVEVDHDDDLSVDCLEKIVEAFKNNPECGFAYGDAAEVYEENNHGHWYGWDAGYGWLTYWRQHVHWMGRWQNAQRTTDMNWRTIRHLVGMPNHPRAWTRDCYWLVGGHRPGLSVSDDYDLLVRTMLCTKFVRIPHLIYFQYRNIGSNNFTFIRLGQIQILCSELERYYRSRIDKRIEEFGLPSMDGREYKRIWDVDVSDDRWKTCTVTHWNREKTSVIIPVVTSDRDKYRDIVNSTIKECVDKEWKNVELIVVGSIGAEVEEASSSAPSGAIRWWTLEDPKFVATIEQCVRWGMLIRSGGNVQLSLHQDDEKDRDTLLQTCVLPLLVKGRESDRK